MSIVNTKDTGRNLVVSNEGVNAIPSAVEDVCDNLTKQCIARDWLPAVFGEPLPTINVDNKRGFDSSDQYVNGWIARIKEELYSIPSVEDIYVGIEDTDVDVWVVIPERDIAALDQLADIEWKLLEILVSGKHPAFLIDFHIIYRCGRNIEDLAPTRAIRLLRQVY